MIRRSFRRGLGLGLLVGAVAAVVKMVQARRPGQSDIRVETYGSTSTSTSTSATPAPAPPPVAFTPTPAPMADPEPEPVAEEAPLPPPAPVAEPEPAAPVAPVKKKAAPKKKATPKAVDPVDGVCPDSHPVKGKLASGLFHQPGGLAYPRTKPDRCYIDASAAEADGLRPAKR